MSGLFVLGVRPGEGWRTAPAVGETRAGRRARGGRRGGEGVEAASRGGVTRGVDHLPLKQTNGDKGLPWRCTDESAVFPMCLFNMKTTEI